MIQLKDQVDKTKLFRELKDQVYKLCKNKPDADNQFELIIKGARLMFNRLRQTTKPKKITAREFFKNHYKSSYVVIIDKFDKDKKQFDYHDLIYFAEQYKKAKNDN